MPRKPKHWAYVALRSPESLVKRRDSLPENLRDVPAKRKALVLGLVEEHGGPARLSVKEALLIDRIGRLWPYLELIDRAAFDSGQPDARPVDYIALHNALTRTVKALAEIGAEKRDGNETIDLRRYLEGKSKAKPAGGVPEGRPSDLQNQQDAGAGVRSVSAGSG